MVKIKICLCVLLVVAFTNVNVNADETVPIYTKKGDALSADVLNDLFGRVAAVSDGFESSQDIVGTWSCTTYTSRDCSSFGFSPTGGGILATRTQDMVFSCTGNSCQWNAIDFVPFNCQLDNPVYKSSGYELTGNILTTQFGMASVQKVSPTKFIWQITGSLPQMEYTSCTKKNIPPNAPTNLNAEVIGNSVTLSWNDNSTDETGFQVARRIDDGEWIIAVITSANVTTYIDVPSSSGNYIYRVSAVNTYGVGVGSNVVPVEILN